MEITVVIILLLIGIILFLLELFLIPGLSIAGIAGTISIIGAVIYAYTEIGTTAGHITFTGSIVLTAIAIWIFLRSRALERLSLKTEIDGKNEPLKDVVVEIGDTGITVSRLAPMGKVKVNGYIMEAKTSDDFIDEGEDIVILEIFKTNVLVERKK